MQRYAYTTLLYSSDRPYCCPFSLQHSSRRSRKWNKPASRIYCLIPVHLSTCLFTLLHSLPCSTDHSGRVVWRMNCLRPLECSGLYVYCVCVDLCVGRGLATGSSPVQWVPLIAYKAKVQQNKVLEALITTIIPLFLYLLISFLYLSTDLLIC